MVSKIKHQWSLRNNYLFGITAGQWVRLLRENRFSVDPVYWYRASFISLLSLINSWYARRERTLEAGLEEVELAAPPVFILGHWRSGTSFLFSLLASDDATFAYPNTYQVANPLSFLCSEEVNTRRFSRLLTSRRLMDNMRTAFSAPQEDEFATALMTLRSLYLGITFNRRAEYYERYLSFDGVDEDEVREWEASLDRFLRKLTLKYGRRLVLKSPPHTARVARLLRLYPDARFIHIHRHPCDVFQSSRHYFDAAMWYTFLQKPDLSDVDGSIVRRYRRMYDAFFRDRPLIPVAQYAEVRFEDLEKDPERELERVYSLLGLPGFEQFLPRLRMKAEEAAGYTKNAFPELPEDTRAMLYREWRPCFDAWGYAP